MALRRIVSSLALAGTAAALLAGCGGSSASGAAKAPMPGSDDEARARLGDYFAEVLLSDQGTDAARARTELRWRPSRPGLVEELCDGGYAGQPAASG
jgi:hypothetical protein